MKRALAACLLFAAACAQAGTTDGSGDATDGGVTTNDGAPQNAEGGVTCASGLCPARPNAIMTCNDAGACAIGSCLGKSADCNGDPNDGCEVDLATDPANCGMCKKACAPVSGGTAKCAASACGVSCTSGFAPLGSACASFGGAYEENDTGCTACGALNSLAGTCGCPAGFTGSTTGRVLNDCSGTHGARLTFCQAVGTPATGDWAGAYEIDDSSGTCPQGCRAPNPYTTACTCPAGATPIALRTIVDTPCSQNIGSHLTLCLRATAPTTTFGGAYENDDAVGGGLGCRVPNPKTNGCTCPTGTSPHDYRTLVDVAGGTIGANISICTP